MSKPILNIIGIGDDGLAAVSETTRQQILGAEILVGTDRTLALVPEAPGKHLVVGSDLDEVVEKINAAGNAQIVLLVIGDPLFYGLARFLCEKLGHDRCEITPHVSSMQLAFARVKESWDDAFLTNLASHSLASVVERIRIADKVGLFTTEQCGPGAVANAMLEHRLDYFTIYVCENLGARNERVTCGTVSEIAEQKFESLNVMILVRNSDVPDSPCNLQAKCQFGNPDEAFRQSTPKHGLLTPAEVRTIALAQMALHSDSVVWDVGAGCGAVSVEAAMLAPDGQVFAIDQDVEDVALIRENAERFGVKNVEPTLGSAPEVFADLPDPNAIFIEGSGREVVRLAEIAFGRLQPGGRLVANLISIGSLEELRLALAKQTTAVQVRMISIARGTDQLERLQFEALNPSFLITATKV